MRKLVKEKYYHNMLEVGILAVGIVAIAMVVYSQSLMWRTFDRDAALIRLSDVVQQKIAVAHLWFEEALAGDESIELDHDVYQNIAEVLELLTAALQGGATAFGRVKAVEDKQVRTDLMALQRRTKEWRKMTALRWEGRKTTGRVGKAQDQAYDALFQDILQSSQDIAHAVDRVIAKSRAALMWIEAAIIVVLLLIFVGMAVVVLRHRQAIEAKNAELELRVEERTAQLAESEARFAGILATANEAIISIDESQRTINFNKGAEKIFGYSPDEAIGQSLDLLIPESFQTIHRSHIARFADSTPSACRMAAHLEIVGCRKDGAEFPAEASISKLEVSGKKILTVVLRDVTERKRAEREKSKLETRLRQSQKMEAIGTLAGGIAHDFNNILWVILGNAEMGLRKLSEDSLVRDKLQEILTASKRAKELVEQILTFSRQEEQECKPVQIHFIVKEALRLLQASLPSTIEIRQDIRDCGAVLADPSQIHQVIMNLGTNAYQAMGELGGLLEVSMEVVDLDAKSIKSYPELQIGRFVEMTIRDTGCGMDPTTAERIFDPYFTTKGVGEGTGMGLATVHGIVTGLGGAIKVNSEPGKGSTFRVFLPRHDDSISEESELERETSELRGNEHILVVDDEEQVVTMLGDMLEELGYEVTTETSSVEVLKQFQAHSDRFDLVITDQTMPKVTGLELAEEMVRIRPDIPIILATGFSKIVTEDKIKHSGIRECLKKPIVFHDLEDAIRRALDGKE